MSSSPQPPSQPRFVRRWMARGLLMGLAAGMLGWWGIPWAVPLPEPLLQAQEYSPLFLSSEGRPLRQLLTAEGQKVAQPVTYEQIPQVMIHAMLSAEDKRFFNHGGLDLLAISRALADSIVAGRVTSGASTLTQQLIKVSTGPHKRTLLHKMKEALQARQLEMRWSKQQIITEYLNRVYFGSLLTGVQSAAYGYFGKPLSELTPAECALLAALPQAPSRMNLHQNLPAAQKRQRLVLQLMHENGWLDAEGLELALQEQPVLHRHATAFMAPHATELAAMGLQTLGSQQLQTTIELELQRHVEGVIERHLNRLTDKHVTQAAAVILDNKSGHVLALAGSRDFFNSEGGQINGAWSAQSPGSALKPFTYLLALEKDHTAASIIADLPVEYATSTGLYKPENYDRRLYGPVTLRQALGSSLNIPAVRVLQEIGGEAALLATLQKLGLTTLTEEPAHYGLGLTIGNAPVRLLELTNAYATLARLGEHLPWTLLKDQAHTSPQRRRVFQPETCFIMADILADNQARQLTFGQRSVIRLPFPCAVKTGTSSNYRDNWTLGYTPEYTIGVWAGNFDNSPMNQVSGVTGAGPILRDLFIHLHERRGTSWYKAPEYLVQQSIDPRLGKIALHGKTQPVSNATRLEWFLPGRQAPPATLADYEPQTGRAYLPKEYAAWLKSQAGWQQQAFAIHPVITAPPRIISPTSGSVFVLDPDLPNSGSHLLLRSSLDAEVDAAAWRSATLQIIQEGHQHYAVLTPGQHTLMLLPAGDDGSALPIEVSITVKPPVSASVKLQK